MELVANSRAAAIVSFIMEGHEDRAANATQVARVVREIADREGLVIEEYPKSLLVKVVDPQTGESVNIRANEAGRPYAAQKFEARIQDMLRRRSS